MRRLLVSLLTVSAIATVLVGCSSPHPDAVPVVPSAEQTAVDCTAEPETGRGAIPDDFAPVAVFVCDPVLELELRAGDEDGTGVPSASTEPRLLRGDVEPLLAAFAEPNDPPWPGACSAIGVIVPDVWLVDAAGRAVRPAYPVTGCGLPKEGVSEALALLDRDR